MGKRVGFVGLGQMGLGMATNMVKSGHDLTVLESGADKVRRLKGLGATSVGSVAEMAAVCDVLFLCLPDTEVVQQVIFGEGGVVEGGRSGLVVVDFSTISYQTTLDIAGRLAEQGIRFADAPISGMEARANDGTLTVMYGGDTQLFEELLPYFGSIGNTVINMGPVGSGQLTKLVNQLLFNTAMAAIAEVLPMAAKLGLDPRKVVDVVTTSTGRSYGSEFFAPRILENRFDEGYPLAKAYKDMVSATELSAHQKIPLPMVHTATTTFQMALAGGLGGENKGALIKVFERLLGVEFRAPAG